MTEDYTEVIRDWDVHVATQGGQVIGAENRAIYEHLGYVPYDRRVVDGFPRLFLRKPLG